MGEESLKPSSTPKGAVFLSYASQDAEAAQKICNALRAASIEVWFDKSELRGGDVWDRQIREQIHDCRLFIPVISANTETRDEGYFRREWGFATDRTRDMAEKRAFLIPVVIDDTPERGASVPDKFHQIQWTRLPRGETSPAFVARIATLLGAAIPVATPNGPGPALVSPPPAPTRIRRASWVPLGLAGLTIVAAGGWFALQHSHLHQHAESGLGARPQQAVTEKSIAVLPFVDISEKHDQEYFADGLAEELIDRLSRSPDLKVISRTSSFQFKGKGDDARAIGARLGAAYLLEGSVRKSGPQLRITVQLIRAVDGVHVWSHSYDRTISEIFEVQKDIAGIVAQALHPLASAPGSPTGFQPNIDAYTLVLKGKFLKDRWVKADVDRAIALYREALKIEPNYPLAWALLGGAYVNEAYAGWLPSDVAKAEAAPALKRAVELDPSLIEALFYLASVYIYIDFNWEAAQREIDRMREIDADSDWLWTAVAYLARPLGHLKEGIDANRRIRLRNPLDQYSLDDEAWLLYAKGDLQESAGVRQQLVDLNPSYAGAQAALGLVYLMMGRYDDALTAINKESDEKSRWAALPIALWAMDHRSESDEALHHLESNFGGTAPYAVAVAHAYRHELDDAMTWLSRAYEKRDSSMTSIADDPGLQNIRDDARYAAILRKMNLQR